MSSGLLLLSAAAAANCRDESSSTETSSSHRRVSDRCDDERVAFGGLTSSSFSSSSLSLPSSSLSSPASHPCSLSKLPLKKRLKSAFRSPPNPSERTLVPHRRGEEASLSFSGGGGDGTTFPRDHDLDGRHVRSFSNRLACPSKQLSWEAQLAACKELCKLDLVDMRFAASAAAEGSSCENASSRFDCDDDEERRVHPRASKAVGRDRGRSGGSDNRRKEGENSSSGSNHNSKEGSSSSSSSSSSASSQKQQPPRKRNFSAYRFDCKDENGRDMGMGYFSMGAASSSSSSPSLSSPPHAHQHRQRHPLPQRQSNRDDDDDKPVAVVSRENFAKFRFRTDSDASVLLSTATATDTCRRPHPHPHVHPRLSPWTSRQGRIGSGGHLFGIDDGDDIFREYQKSAFLMSRLTVKSESASPDLLLRGGAASTASSSPSLLAPNVNRHGKGNESWSSTAADKSKALSSSSSSSFGNGGAMMHPIPTTLHALSNLKKRSKETTRFDCNRSDNNSNNRMTSSSPSFFVLHSNSKKTVRSHSGSHLQPFAGDDHRHHDHHHRHLDRNATTATSTAIQHDREADMPKLRNFVKHASSREEATQEFVQAYIRTLQVRNHANMM